ncbi:MAG: ketol-acid reductoisomerase [Phycisphaerae bacterium]|nr:ketol-acid reductoisomerase [Phycisphaerae bacterium]
MPLNVMYESDADRAILFNRTIAVLGYGSQGQAHAQNLRDSGYVVVVGQREGGNADRARSDGFDVMSISEAVSRGDLLIFGLPDEQMGLIYESDIRPNVRAGQALGFIHGFAIRFGLIAPPPEVDVVMIAPKGPGPLVRDVFRRGGGLTCLLAVHQDATGQARDIALAWGCGIGGGRGGMLEATFAQECEADLFGEQTVLCGGVIELMKSAFDILVEAGLPEELAYFECVHELKQITDMQYAGGLAAMRSRISGTACYGGLRVGPRLIDGRVQDEMRRVLAEIRDGRFAREWVSEHVSGRHRLNALKEAEAMHCSEAVGKRIRELSAKAIPKPDSVLGGVSARHEF